jgi:hypothetical protein
MPSKGKRVAARQSNLRRRRGGANRGAPARNAAATVASAVAETAANLPVSIAAATTEVEARPQTRAAAVGRPAAAPRGRRFDRPAAYNHVGSELRRIGIFSGVLVVVLVAVSFVL